MGLTTKAKREEFNQMSEKERAAYLAGGRVTAKKYSRVNFEEKTLEPWWIPRLRSMPIKTGRHDTKEEALEEGRKFKEKCKRIANQ